MCCWAELHSVFARMLTACPKLLNFSKREEDEQGTYCIFTSAYRGSKNVNIAADPGAWMGRVSDEYDQEKLSGALS